MNSLIKKIFVILPIMGLIILSSCSRDLPIKNPRKKYPPISDTTKTNHTLQGSFTVDYIPSQCARTHSGILGLTANGEYYLVVGDKSKTFSSFVQGDKVRAKIELNKEVIVCEACICPAPDAGVVIHTIRKE